MAQLRSASEKLDDDGHGSGRIGAYKVRKGAI